MTTYKVKLVSQTNAAILIVGVLTVFICGVLYFIPHGAGSNGSAWLVTAVSFGVVYFLWQRFVTGRTEWTIDANEISIIWTKKFPFSGEIDLTIKWDDVKEISKGPDPQYYCLRIKLVSGMTIKFYHDSLTTRDDFEECLKTLNQIFGEKSK